MPIWAYFSSRYVFFITTSITHSFWHKFLTPLLRRVRETDYPGSMSLKFVSCKWIPHVAGPRRYQPVALYPSVEEDIAVIVDGSVPAARVQGIIQAAPLVRSARLFDVYSGPQVPSGKKSLAFSISYQAADHTLTDEEVRRQQERILARLRKELDAVLRG